jgi:hemerythrin-like domain-containing protein
MEATEVTTQMTICGGPIPDLEVPMITTMVTCLGIEHGKLNYGIVQLASAATRLSTDPDSVTANQRALQVWDQIRHDLWSHLQIEEELVFSWGTAHHAISDTLLDTLKSERQEMRRLMTTLRTFAETLLALARMLDSHVERHDGEVLPSILRALFHK